MNGTVNESLEAVVRIRVRGAPGTRIVEVNAAIDTGFSGVLSLPDALIRQLQLPRVNKTTVVLGDGSKTSLDLYSGQVEWSGNWQSIVICAATNEALIGIQLLNGSELRIQVVPGGTVEITPL